MSSLATLPRPQATQMELPTVSFFGRTLDEYGRFFSLEPYKLRGQAVLDVTPVRHRSPRKRWTKGIDAVAVDPQYDQPAGELSDQVRDDYQRMFTQMRAKPHLFRLKAFPSLRAAAENRPAGRGPTFLTDYEGNVRHGRYLRAALPLLPFLDGAFDLVLCAHLLFIYAARFDFDWHVVACAELARVSSGEVRIHPVCEANGRPYAELSRLRAELSLRGVLSEVVPVDYEFFAGGTSMLVLKRNRDDRLSQRYS